MEIRQARPDDREAIFELYRVAYADWQQRIPERWLWQFMNNPFANPDQPCIFLAVDDEGRIMGQTSSVMEPLQVNGTVHPMGWVVDVFVHPEFRGQGVAKALKKVQKSQKDMIEMSISMVDAMRHIVQNLGSQPLPSLEVHLLRVHPRAVADAMARRIGGGFLGFLFLASRLGELYGRLLNGSLDRKARRRAKSYNDVEFRPLDAWGEEGDALWASLAVEIPHGVVRNSQYLNWKYHGQPHVEYECFMAYRQETPVGYLVLRRQKQRGILVDLLFSPQDREGIMAGLDFAVAYFQAAGLSEVRAGGTHPALVSCLKEAGYRRPVHTMAPLFYTTRDLDVDSLLRAPWWFTLGDHDIQQ